MKSANLFSSLLVIDYLLKYFNNFQYQVIFWLVLQMASSQFLPAGYHSPVKEISHLASATPVAGSRESLKSLSTPYYPAINLNFTLDGMVLCLIEQKSTELVSIAKLHIGVSCYVI